jgi:hypothetical protein
MNSPSRMIVRAALAMIVAVALSLCLAWPAAAQDQPAPPAPPAPPKSISVQAHVIMASKAQMPHVEDSLKEVAELLQKRFKDMFNRFRLHKTASGETKLKESQTLALVDKYHLKVAYNASVEDPEKKEQKYQVTYTLMRRVQVTEGEKTVTKDEEIQPVQYTVAPGVFVLMAGPTVGEETLILAIRVAK